MVCMALAMGVRLWVVPAPAAIYTNTCGGCAGGGSPLTLSGPSPVESAGMDDLLLYCAAVGGAVGAVTGLWNAFKLSRLKGRVDQLSTQVNSHVNTPGLHGR